MGRHLHHYRPHPLVWRRRLFVPLLQAAEEKARAEKESDLVRTCLVCSSTNNAGSVVVVVVVVVMVVVVEVVMVAVVVEVEVVVAIIVVHTPPGSSGPAVPAYLYAN